MEGDFGCDPRVYAGNTVKRDLSACCYGEFQLVVGRRVKRKSRDNVVVTSQREKSREENG